MLMNFRTIQWNEQTQTVSLLDQTRLPNEEVYETYGDYREVAVAIYGIDCDGHSSGS